MNALLIFLALKVSAIGAGTGVESRTLVGVASKFPADGQPVFVHATLTHEGAPAPITWVWRQGSTERWRTTQTISPSEGWRTWTRMHMPKESVGSWTVEVQDAQGTVLHAVLFDVVPAGG